MCLHAASIDLSYRDRYLRSLILYGTHLLYHGPWYSNCCLGLDKELLKVQHVIPTGKQLANTPQLAQNKGPLTGEPAGICTAIILHVN
jgi:hypothetical protein